MIDDYYEADFVITRETGQLGGCLPKEESKEKKIGKKEKRAEV